MYPVKSTRLTVTILLALIGFCGLISTTQAMDPATSSEEAKRAGHNQSVEMADHLLHVPLETPAPTLATLDHTPTIQPTTMIGELVLPSNDPIEPSTDQSTPAVTAYPSPTNDSTTETDEPVPPGDPLESPTPISTATPVPATVEPVRDNTPTPESCTDDAFEPNNTFDTAKFIMSNSAPQNHNLCLQQDKDWIFFTAEAKKSYTITIKIEPQYEDIDIVIELYDRTEQLLTDNSDDIQGALNTQIVYKFDNASMYYVKISLPYSSTLYGAGTAYKFSIQDSNNIPTPVPTATRLPGDGPPDSVESTPSPTLILSTVTPTVMPTATIMPKRDRLAIILAGRNEEDDSLQPNIEHIAQRAFDLFKSHGYDDEDIYYLTTDESAIGFDDLATNNNLQFAIENWAAERLHENSTLTLYIMDHGKKGVIYIDGMNGEQLTPADLDQWLTTLEGKVSDLMINVIIEACRSGSFLLGPGRIGKEGRVIITSSSATADAHASQDGAYFSDIFISALRHQDLYSSFQEARESLLDVKRWMQDPLIDSNGNGKLREQEDKEIASQRYLSDQGALTDTRPEIIKNQAKLIISNRRGQVRVRIEDNGTVQKVWAIVYPPSYKPPASGKGQLVNGDPDGVISLEHQGDNIYIGSGINFDELGTYKIVVQATDNENMTAVPLILEVGSDLYFPFIKR